MIDNFPKYTLCVTLKKKYGRTITEEFSNILTTSGRKPVKTESDRGKEIYDIFRNILKLNNKHHYSRFTDKSLQ